MHFRYKEHQGAIDLRRPIVEIVLRNPRDNGAPMIAYEALVDSGSDRNIFPSELADSSASSSPRPRTSVTSAVS